MRYRNYVAVHAALEAWDRYRLTLHEGVILVKLGERMGPSWSTELSYSSLASAACVAKATVPRAAASLVEKRLLQVLAGAPAAGVHKGRPTLWSAGESLHSIISELERAWRR